MASTTRFFRQAVPDIDLSLERNSHRVASDGSYYVLLRGEIKGKFRSKAKALELYRALLESSGYTPPVEDSQPTRNEAVEGYLDTLEDYWSQSYKHARRGGKGRF